MKTEELIERLSAFNEWRRGAETPQPSPKDIGEWIERACEILDEQARVLESLEAAMQSVTSLSKTLREERDEARADRDILRIDAQKEDVHHDRLLNELDRVYKERDEAREALRTLAEHGETEIQRLTKERDEAREVLREIQAANWRTAGELRGMARRALEGEIENPKETQSKPKPNPKETQPNPKVSDR